MLPAPQINFQRTPVTLILTAIAVAIELVCQFNPPMRGAYYQDYHLGIMSPIWQGELWRPLTTSILHGSLLHAAVNAYWIIIFGPALESRFGSYRMLGLIVLLSFVSMLPQFIVTNYNVSVSEQIPIVGLSGIVYGLFGILWVGRRFQPELRQVCSDQTVQFLLFWFLFCIVATQLNLLPVANIAHGAGLAFGVIYGLSIFDVQRRRQWATIATVATLVVLATLVYCPGHNGYEYSRQLRRLGGRSVKSFSVTPTVDLYVRQTVSPGLWRLARTRRSRANRTGSLDRSRP